MNTVINKYLDRMCERYAHKIIEVINDRKVNYSTYKNLYCINSISDAMMAMNLYNTLYDGEISKNDRPEFLNALTCVIIKNRSNIVKMISDFEDNIKY